MPGSRHNSRRAKTTTRPRKPVINEDNERSSNEEGGGTGQYQVETLPGLGKFIRDYEAKLTSLQISSNSSSALFPLGKRPFIVLGYNGPDILHAPFQSCAIWNKSFSELSPPTKEFLGNGKWESNVRNVLADQLFFYKSYLPPSLLRRELVSTGTLSGGRLWIHHLTILPGFSKSTGSRSPDHYWHEAISPRKSNK